jgi:predicted N-acyltransferase
MVSEIVSFLKRKRVELVIIKDHINSYNTEYFRKKFIHLHFMPGTYIDLNCNCFDEFLMRLKKKWRANIRNRINKRKSDLKIVVINAADLTESECEICHALYFQTRGKQRLKHELLSQDYFCECGKNLGENCKMLVAKSNEKIIGFAQLLVSESDVINVRMGMDYQYNKEYNLYYHLLYENILYCFKNGKKRLYTSQTCYRPKIEAGAKLLPLHTYICFQNPVLQKIFGSIIKGQCKCYSELLESDNPAQTLAKYKKLCS